MDHYPEKPKKKPPDSDDLNNIYREFYRRLFVTLTVPALILGMIFALPGLFFSLLAPDNPHLATCTTFDGEQGIRIVSQRWETNDTSFYWTDNGGTTWYILDTVESTSSIVAASCDQVLMDEDIIAIYHQATIILVDHAGRYDRVHLPVCKTINTMQRYPHVDAPEIQYDMVCNYDQDVILRWSMEELSR